MQWDGKINELLPEIPWLLLQHEQLHLDTLLQPVAGQLQGQLGATLSGKRVKDDQEGHECGPEVSSPSALIILGQAALQCLQDRKG